MTMLAATAASSMSALRASRVRSTPRLATASIGTCAKAARVSRANLATKMINTAFSGAGWEISGHRMPKAWSAATTMTMTTTRSLGTMAGPARSNAKAKAATTVAAVSSPLRQASIATRQCVAPARMSVSTFGVGPVAMKRPLFATGGARRGFASSSRSSGGYDEEVRRKNATGLVYMLSIVVAAVGLSYTAVPLYKVFCQVTGYGGTTRQSSLDKARSMQPVPGANPITVKFTANTADSLGWKFKPQQSEVRVVPGETALAFYTATNNTDEAITGVASYNITPTKAGIYFNKIQCFCFDQQRLKPNEEVDMPVFFYIDPTFADDPQMAGIDNIVLSYTFFKAKN